MERSATGGPPASTRKPCQHPPVAPDLAFWGAVATLSVCTAPQVRLRDPGRSVKQHEILLPIGAPARASQLETVNCLPAAGATDYAGYPQEGPASSLRAE